jgi:hypothetical protein
VRRVAARDNLTTPRVATELKGAHKFSENFNETDCSRRRERQQWDKGLDSLHLIADECLLVADTVAKVVLRP